MTDKGTNQSGQENKKSGERKPYHQPAVIYQGKITIRAGSPLDPIPGSSLPFDFTDDK